MKRSYAKAIEQPSVAAPITQARNPTLEVFNSANIFQHLALALASNAQPLDTTQALAMIMRQTSKQLRACVEKVYYYQSKEVGLPTKSRYGYANLFCWYTDTLTQHVKAVDELCRQIKLVYETEEFACTVNDTYTKILSQKNISGFLIGKLIAERCGSYGISICKHGYTDYSVIQAQENIPGGYLILTLVEMIIEEATKSEAGKAVWDYLYENGFINFENEKINLPGGLSNTWYWLTNDHGNGSYCFKFLTQIIKTPHFFQIAQQQKAKLLNQNDRIHAFRYLKFNLEAVEDLFIVALINYVLGLNSLERELKVAPQDIFEFAITGMQLLEAEPNKNEIHDELCKQIPTLLDEMLNGFYDKSQPGNFNPCALEEIGRHFPPRMIEALRSALIAVNRLEETSSSTYTLRR